MPGVCVHVAAVQRLVDLAFEVGIVDLSAPVEVKMSFASMMDGTFGYDFGGMMPKKLRNAKDEFTESLCARLEHVTLENRNAYIPCRIPMHEKSDSSADEDSPGCAVLSHCC